jgi:hypothetical protein
MPFEPTALETSCLESCSANIVGDDIADMLNVVAEMASVEKFPFTTVPAAEACNTGVSPALIVKAPLFDCNCTGLFAELRVNRDGPVAEDTDTDADDDEEDMLTDCWFDDDTDKEVVSMTLADILSNFTVDLSMST